MLVRATAAESIMALRGIIESQGSYHAIRAPLLEAASGIFVHALTETHKQNDLPVEEDWLNDMEDAIRSEDPDASLRGRLYEFVVAPPEAQRPRTATLLSPSRKR